MDAAFKTNFKDLYFTTLCCNRSTSLNDLKYKWPAGFAKFAIIIADPVIDIENDRLDVLETILGTKIRKIWAHY